MESAVSNSCNRSCFRYSGPDFVKGSSTFGRLGHNHVQLLIRVHDRLIGVRYAAQMSCITGCRCPTELQHIEALPDIRAKLGGENNPSKRLEVRTKISETTKKAMRRPEVDIRFKESIAKHNY